MLDKLQRTCQYPQAVSYRFAIAVKLGSTGGVISQHPQVCEEALNKACDVYIRIVSCMCASPLACIGWWSSVCQSPARRSRLAASQYILQANPRGLRRLRNLRTKAYFGSSQEGFAKLPWLERKLTGLLKFRKSGCWLFK